MTAPAFWKFMLLPQVAGIASITLAETPAAFGDFAAGTLGKIAITVA